MADPVVIENPILNSPFGEPARFHEFDRYGTPTGRILEGRRKSGYFIPVAQPRRQAVQAELFEEEPRENDDINYVRSRVALWRDRQYPGVSPVTRQLLNHWRDPRRERRLYFCQVEAAETLVFLTEAATTDEALFLDKLQALRAAAGTKLPRLACKMATGSGKTAVMAMLIAWHTLNKRRNPRGKGFSDTFLVVAPGITIKDRLRVLIPSDPHNAYEDLDLVPAELRADLGAARVVVTNYHAFKAKETMEAGTFTKKFLGRGDTTIYQESPEQIVNRVCRELGKARNIVVLNDEAHHCYRKKEQSEGGLIDKLSSEDERESKERNKAAAQWLTGLESVQAKVGVQAVYDLSATPFYLRGSGYPEGTLFPWVVSDFALIDAIESGIVKVPRVPVADSSMSGELPTFRDLWVRIRDGLPKRTRGADADTPTNLPRDLEAALLALYAHYEQSFREWEADPEGRTPPVFIVVCNNTAVSKMVFDWIAGRDTAAMHHDDTPVMTAGNLRAFTNSDGGRRLHRPNTILVDSRQLESDEGMSPDFKKLAAGQIEEFKADYRRRFPGRTGEDLSDADLMREVLNTVGKAGRLGENVKCVVSVSMLTEGWDCNTVTHVLGVRAFGTQLLCEQVVGRGLRRMDFTVNADGHFEPEYAEVIGVPFRFLPCAAMPKERVAAKQSPPGRVAADPARLIDRPWLEITFPRVAQYRYQLTPQTLTAKFGPESRVVLTTERITVEAEVAPIVGEDTRISLDELKTRRLQEVAFRIARLVIEKYATDGTGPAWLFPQVLEITRRWLAEHVVCKDDTFPQLLLLTSEAHQAAEKIHRAIADANPGERLVRAVLQDGEGPGTTAKVSFETRKKTWRTDPKKCHLNLVPEDSGWESKFAQTLEGMPEVLAYVKNQSLGFRIPYTLEGVPGNYYPDFILKVDDGRGPADPLNVVVEISGRDLLEKQAKADTAAKLWVPAVNHEQTFGRWAFLEVRDPYNSKADLREFFRQQSLSGQLSRPTHS